MNSNTKLTRRALLQTAIVITPVAMTGCVSFMREREPFLRETDPVARSLSYYSNTRNVSADDPLAANHNAEQSCSNCVHSRGSVGPGRIDCPMFPGRSVNKNGWCTVWAQG